MSSIMSNEETKKLKEKLTKNGVIKSGKAKNAGKELREFLIKEGVIKEVKK